MSCHRKFHVNWNICDKFSWKLLQSAELFISSYPRNDNKRQDKFDFWHGILFPSGVMPLDLQKTHQFLRFIFKMFSSPWAKYLKLLKLILFGHNTLVKVKFVYYPFYGSRVMHVPSFVISLDQMFRFLYTIILKIMFDYVYYASWFPKYCFSFLYTKNFFHVSKLNTNLLILNCLFVSVLQLAFNTLITMFNFF